MSVASRDFDPVASKTALTQMHPWYHVHTRMAEHLRLGRGVAHRVGGPLAVAAGVARMTDMNWRFL